MLDARRAGVSAAQEESARAQAIADATAVRRAAAEAWIDLWAAQRAWASLQDLREQAALVARLSKACVAGGSAAVSDALATEPAVLEIDNRIEAAQGEGASMMFLAVDGRLAGTVAVADPIKATRFNSAARPNSSIRAGQAGFAAGRGM